MTALRDVVAALAEQIRDAIGAEAYGIQVEPGYLISPTTPSIDVYPANPFLTQTAMGSWQAVWIVRARVSTVDQDAGQGLFLDLMDPTGPLSVIAAIRADTTLGGTVDSLAFVTEPTGFVRYDEQLRLAMPGGSFLGCEWLVTTELST
jgi:hypothetical protein